jgi:hypothetical protein
MDSIFEIHAMMVLFLWKLANGNYISIENFGIERNG